MSPEEFASLKRGDISRLINGDGNSYVIVASPSANSHIAMRSVIVSNPREWVLFKPEPSKPRVPRELVLRRCSADDSKHEWVVNPQSSACPHCEVMIVREVRSKAPKGTRWE